MQFQYCDFMIKTIKEKSVYHVTQLRFHIIGLPVRRFLAAHPKIFKLLFVRGLVILLLLHTAFKDPSK